jgi:hypothetical protein
MPRRGGRSGQGRGRPQGGSGAQRSKRLRYVGPSAQTFITDTPVSQLRQGRPIRPVAQPLLPMVPTMGVCPTGKLRWSTPEDAQEALRRAQHNRAILRSPIVENRWHPQPGTADKPCVCGGYHLTSQPKPEEHA